MQNMVFCTLFDSNYYARGLLMYRSLCNVSKGFAFYVLAMDEECEEMLKSHGYENMKVINLDSFVEKMGLATAKTDRKWNEFCWTCSSFLIDYVLTVCNEEICTYIDSDMYFYSDPKCLLDEIGDCDVQIIEHRFGKGIEGRHNEKYSGKYCVEFNTFKNNTESLKLLRWWESKSLESCSDDYSNKKVFGDQKYLDEWDGLNNVCVIQNPGAGIAPWNIGQYRLASNSLDGIKIMKKGDRKVFDLIFYHFHSLKQIDEGVANISVYERHWNVDQKLVEALYFPYLRKLEEITPIKKNSDNTASENKKKEIKSLSYYYEQIQSDGFNCVLENAYMRFCTIFRNRAFGKKNSVRYR